MYNAIILFRRVSARLEMMTRSDNYNSHSLCWTRFLKGITENNSNSYVNATVMNVAHVINRCWKTTRCD